MRKDETPQRIASPDRRPKVVLLFVLVGGTGRAAYDVHFRLSQGRSTPEQSILLDPDPESRSISHADQNPDLDFNATMAKMLRANSALFGKHIGRIFVDLKRKLSPDEIGHGMRTTRPLAQLWFAYYYNEIVKEIRQAINHLRGPHTILPVIVSSSGGGTGSALTVLLLEAFCDAAFRSQILLGMPEDVLASRPIVFVADPFAYAREAQELKQRKILGNVFGFRLEMEHLLRQMAAEYVYQIGFSNARTAIVTGDMMARVLGTALYTYQSCYDLLKSRGVDHQDDVAATVRYCGLDFVRTLRRNAGPNASSP